MQTISPEKTAMPAERQPLRNSGRTRRPGKTTAQRQAEFRAKRDARLIALEQTTSALLDALAGALEAAGCTKLMDNLPDHLLDTAGAAEELTRRLVSRKLIDCKREGK